MEPIISKLQEGVKYPRFERDATTIINDLVEHITKERGVYSSSIEPNPNEHKVWFNTNNNTLNIYENGRWNTISGQGGGSGSIPSFLSGIYGISMIDGTISGIKALAINSSGYIYATGATIKGGTISGATITDGNISGATIKDGYLTGSINANSATLHGVAINSGSVSNSTISYCTLTGSIDASDAIIDGATISGGNIHGATLGGINVTSGSINSANINNSYISGGTLKGTINATNATISGGNIDINKVKAKSIETPLLNLTSGSTNKSIQLLGDNYVFNGKLADSTLFHSIDLGSGSIAGLTSIKTLSYTGLTIEPYDTTGTGTPIKIYGMAAGVYLYGIASLNWQKGTSYGNSMTFNTNNNIINSNFDSFNISNGLVALTSGMISGSANIDLSLYGTISGVTIKDGYLTGSISASGATINGATISGGTISGGTISGGTISGASIVDAFITGSTTINGATISGATMSGGNIYGASIGNVTINSGSALLYAGSKILVTYTGSVSNPILMPSGGNIGYPTASLNLCGVTLTGGDFTKLKNLQ